MTVVPTDTKFSDLIATSCWFETARYLLEQIILKSWPSFELIARIVTFIEYTVFSMLYRSRRVLVLLFYSRVPVAILLRMAVISLF